MKILYCGIITNTKLFEDIFNKSNLMPFAQQKLEKLIIDGFIENGISADTEILSTIPIKRYPSYPKVIIKKRIDEELGIKTTYINFINLPLIKQFSVFFSNLIQMLKWTKKNKKYDKKILIYGTNPLYSIPALLVRFFTKTKIIAYVTEIDSLRIFKEKNIFDKMKKSIFIKTSKFVENNFDGYILITDNMKEKINKKKKPICVIEGMVSFDYQDIDLKKISREKTIVYAGSLHKRYGIERLIKGFLEAKLDGYKLIIYGNGDYVSELKKIVFNNPLIEYKGVALNEIIISEERKASLLINPRPSEEQLTRYSFPSKIFEYMLSGTPCLVTKLDGIPKEYYRYCFIIENETVDGFSDSIRNALINNSLEKRFLMAFNARNFLLKNKTNIIQTRKIIDFMNKI